MAMAARDSPFKTESSGCCPEPGSLKSIEKKGFRDANLMDLYHLLSRKKSKTR